MIKAPKKLGIEGSYLNKIKGIYDKYYTEWGEKLKIFSLKSGMIRDVQCLHS
jgi:hypothetical protein